MGRAVVMGMVINQFVGTAAVLMALTWSCAARAEQVIDASVGEGGRDLVPRIRLVSASDHSPFISLELHGDAVEADSGDVLRLQPLIASGLTPLRDLTFYVGVGPGAGVWMHHGSFVSAAGLLALRSTAVSHPIVIELRGDTLGHVGYSTTLNLAVELVR